MAANGQIRLSAYNRRDVGSAIVIDSEKQRELHALEGCRSAGSAKLDAGLGELPAQGGRVDARIAAQARHWFACQIPPCGRCEELVGELAHRGSTRDISTVEVSQCCVPVDSEDRGKLADVDAGGVQVDQVVDLGAGQPPLPLECGSRVIRALSPGEGAGQDLDGPIEVVRGFESRP